MTRKPASAIVRLRRLGGAAALGVALATLFAVMLSPAVGAQAPEVVAVQRILDVGDCAMHTSLFVVALSDDEARAGRGNGWVSPGRAYRGSLEAAAAAVGGSLVASDLTEAWVIQASGEGDVALQLRRLTATDGASVWLLGDRIRKSPCEDA